MRNVELLKLRFGESSLLSCDIMLRDIRESRRLLTSAKDEMSLWKNDTFEAVVCSKVCIESILKVLNTQGDLVDMAQSCR